MPFIPPDPGDLARILGGLRVQLADLEKIARDHEDGEIALAVEMVRALVTRLEQRLQNPVG